MTAHCSKASEVEGDEEDFQRSICESLWQHSYPTSLTKLG